MRTELRIPGIGVLFLLVSGERDELVQALNLPGNRQVGGKAGGWKPCKGESERSEKETGREFHGIERSVTRQPVLAKTIPACEAHQCRPIVPWRDPSGGAPCDESGIHSPCR